MINEIISQYKQELSKALEHFQTELASVRTGRAHPALVTTVMVESYGVKMPLQQVANITVTDAKTLTISPWDKSQLPEIEKGIIVANLGFMPSNDGQVIRINLPPLTEDRRKEMVRLVGQMAEHARIAVRQIREEMIKNIRRLEDQGEATKDDITEAQKKVQVIVDDFNKQIKEISLEKEKELITV